MQNSLTFNDMKLLIKQKAKIIFIITILGAIIFGVYTISSNFFNDEEVFTEVVEEPMYDFDTLINTEQVMLSDHEIDFIEETLLEEAYSFRVYVENQDGSVFSRKNLLEEILISPGTLEAIEEASSIKIDPYKDYFLDIDLNTDNVIYTITIGLGNETENQEVSNAYYEAFQNEEIDIINNKVIKLFESPQRVVDEQEDGIVPVTSEQSSLSDVVVSAFIGSVLGFSMGIVIIFISTLFEKRMSPIYNHQLQDNDLFINFSYLNMDDTERFKALQQIIQYPNDSKKLIVSDDFKLIDKLQESIEDNLAFPPVIKANVYNIDPSYRFDEIIIITQNQITEKNWYTKVKNQVQIYKKPIQIVKFK